MALGLLLLLFTVYAAVVLVLLDQVEIGRSALKEEWREVDYALDLSRSSRELETLVFRAAMENELPSPDEFTAAENKFLADLERLRDYQLQQHEANPGHQAEEGSALDRIVAGYAKIQTRLDIVEASPSLARFYYTDLYPMFQELESEIGIFTSGAEGETEEAIETIKLAQKHFEDALIAWTIGLVILVTIFFAVFTVYFVRPIERLNRGVQRIAQRKFDERISVRRRNELGRLAEAFNSMAAELHEYHSQVQSELHRSERLASIGRLAAGVAHEINNPLASIAACSEGILRRWSESENGQAAVGRQEREYLELIRDEVYRCKGITEKLLNFSRKKPASVQSVELTSLVQESLELVRHQNPGHEVGLTVHVPADPIHVKADAEQIKQVLLNLLINAFDAVGARGEIELRIDIEGEFARLEISDSGKGMDGRELDQLFEPFFTTKEPGSGTGLGLAISYSIVEAHGGRLDARSEGRAKGSTLTMTLPLDSSSSKAGVEAEARHDEAQ